MGLARAAWPVIPAGVMHSLWAWPCTAAGAYLWSVAPGPGDAGCGTYCLRSGSALHSYADALDSGLRR